MQRFFEKLLHNSIFWLTFATETKNKQVMKEIYIETIYHGNTIAGVGSVFSSRKKAVAHCKQIAKEQGTIMYVDCYGNFGVQYRINGVAVNISMKESRLQ